MELIQKVQDNWKYFLINIHIVAQGANKSDSRNLGVRQNGVFGFLLRINQGFAYPSINAQATTPVQTECPLIIHSLLLG